MSATDIETYQPLPDTGLTRACRVDRLRPGDVVYGPPDLAAARLFK